jgi:uncharacterized protein
MKITFLGGADEVGASSSLVEIGGKRLLIDAGLRISPRTSRGIQNSQLPDLQIVSQSGGPDYILVTHAHTDHTGALPLVTEQYPHTPVIMTRPTEALTRTLQKDAQKIMKGKQEEEGELPLFDQVSVDTLFDSVQEVEFRQPLKLGDNLQVTYYVSGHIAGAALLVLESPEGTFVMSGDISVSEQRTVNSIDVPRIKADALVLESTYGGRLHAERRGEELRLIETLQRIIERGGKVLIPAFALGRAQEVIQIILAYRDRLDVPVYVDGMVRSVCDSYARFADLLPAKTVKVSGEDHLFFREKIKPIRSSKHREEIARGGTACVVVASSGMLTGGASVVYAKHFAPQPENAILLTGYQDEEAPGRFLQRIMREQEEGETPTLKLGDSQVKVRCEVGTYSLSAHADEQELVNIAQAMKASEVMLVHGDHGARHSLATALRRRSIITTTPKIGTEREFKIKAKPWAVGAQVKKGSRAESVDVEKLWESMKDQHANNFFSLRELSQVWWGDNSREKEMAQALEQLDNIYFSADWRNKTTFRVQTQDQVERTKRRRAIMMQNPNIVGKLIVMRNSNNQPRIGLVKNADIDSFEAIVQGSKGSRFPADALLWVIGDWAGVEGVEGGSRKQMNELLKAAKAVQDVILPFTARQQLVEAEEAVDPNDLLPETLPEGVDKQTALVAIVLGLAHDGAVLDDDGLRPTRAKEHGPVEQNEAREIAMKAFPDEARLRKVGIEVARKRLVLSFDFPQAAQRQYAEIIDALIDQTGWDVQVRQTVNQQALSEVVAELMPEDAQITKGPSYYMDKREVHARFDGLEDPKDLAQRFKDMTDFRLVVDQPSSNGSGENAEGQDAPAASIPEGKHKMEINAAYGLIRHALDEHGLNKASLKQGQIVLTFISPQVGERHMEKINELSQQTGYAISVHPHPNQQQILTTAKKLLSRAGMSIRKGPGIHTDRGEVSVALEEQPSEQSITPVSERFEHETGYKLSLD